MECLELAENKLDNGIYLSKYNFNEDQVKTLKGYGLLTLKPHIYVCNVDEQSVSEGNEFSKKVSKFAKIINNNNEYICRY